MILSISHRLNFAIFSSLTLLLLSGCDLNVVITSNQSTEPSGVIGNNPDKDGEKTPADSETPKPKKKVVEETPDPKTYFTEPLLGAPRNSGASIGGNGQIIVSWMQSTYGYTPDNYIIFRSTSSGVSSASTLVATLDPSDRSYTDTTVDNGVKYFYLVAAYRTGDFLAPSEEMWGQALNPSSGTDADLVFADAAAGGGGDGSIGDPFNSIADAYAAVNTGGTMVLVPGTFMLAGNFSIAKTMTIRSPSGVYDDIYANNTIVKGPNTYATSTWATPNNAFDVIVDNVTIQGLSFSEYTWLTDPNDQGVIDIAGALVKNLKVINNYFYENGAAVIATQNLNSTHRVGTSGWVISDNKIEEVDNGANAIHAYQLMDCAIENNIITQVLGAGESGIVTLSLANCSISGNVISNLPGAYAIKIGCDDDFDEEYCQDLTLNHNSLDGNYQAGSASRGDIRINALFSAGSTLTMMYNKITNSGANGISIDAGDLDTFNHEISYNHFSASTQNGIDHNGAGVLTVENNYWGDSGGPDQGAGETLDAGTATIDATPFLTASPIP